MRSITRRTFALALALMLTAGTAGAWASPVAGAALPISREAISVTTTYSSPGDILAEFLIEILSGVWLMNNIMVSFEPYPYADGTKYMEFGSLGASSNYSDDAQADGGSSVRTRAFRFAADTGLFWMNGYSVGNESRIEGYLFKFIGPVVENVLYCKDAAQFGQSGNDAGNLRVGGELALIQTNMISAAFFMEWDHWYGSLKADGIAFGLIARSYPIKPLLIEWRGIAHDMYRGGEEFWMWESILEAGFMAWRNIEIFASWRHIDTREVPLYFTSDKSDGVTAGVRVHF